MTPGEVHQESDELRDAVPRDDRVFHEAPGLARTRPLDDRREDGPADSPEMRLTHRIRRDLGGPTQSVATRHAVHDPVRDLLDVALVELDEEHRLRRSGNVQRLPVQERERVSIDGLDCARASRQDVTDGRAEILEAVEVEEEGDATRRDRHDPERGFRDDAEGTFAADEQGREREDAVVERVRKTEEVVAARMLADRAATRADGLAMIRDL